MSVPTNRTPRVSVIIASYNGARYLAATLDSVLQQTFREFELIVADDGSGPETLAILDRYAAQDSRVRIHRGAHQGLVATLNTAIGLARGDIIARLDHDDIAKAERLAKQVAYLDAHPEAVAVGCDIDVIDAVGRVTKHAKSHSRADAHRPLNFPPQPSGIPGPTLMARTSSLRAVGGYRAQFFAAEDRDLSWRLGAHGDTYRLREGLVQWRTDGQNTSVTKHRTQMASHAIGDLSAVARALGRDDASILADVTVGGDYLPTIERYRDLIADRYPVDTYWFYFLMRYRVWELSGESTEADLLRKVRAHCRANPLDWKRWKLWRRAALFEGRDRSKDARSDT